MSYDVYLEIDTGADEPAEIWWGNMTSNVSGMWRKAMPHTDGLAGFDGMKALSATAVLDAGLQRLQDPAEREAFEAMAPSNGWGSHQSATRFVSDILAACRAHPRTTIRISR